MLSGFRCSRLGEEFGCTGGIVQGVGSDNQCRQVRYLAPPQ